MHPEIQPAALTPRRAGLVVGAVFAVLAAQSWRRWTDPVIDFGAELYLPWRLLEGDRLYAELAYRNGPLSPFVNALWFRLFGVSVDTLVFCNLALLAVLCLLTWRLFAPAGRLAQTLVCVTLLVGFGFANFTAIANYNWVTPYQHSQTHGVLLGFTMIAALGAALRSGSPVAWAAAGICLGLTFLTKAELFVPAAAAAASAAALALVKPRAARPARGLAVFACAALVPPLVAFALLVLAARLPAEVALGGLLGNWNYLDADLLADRFYRKRSGLDDPAGNALAALRSLAAVALALGAALLVDRALARSPRRRGLGIAVGALLVAVFALAGARVPWFDAARALPATSAIGVAALGFAWLRARGDIAQRARLAPLVVFAVYALALLGKMLLAARFGHYGFALAMPATLLLAAGAVEGTAWLARRSFGGGEVARALGVALVLAALLGLWRQSSELYARRDFAVGTGSDAIVVDSEKGAPLAEALQHLDELAAPQATLLVLPEGLSLNYWLRLRNPSRYWLFLPPEFAAAGGEDVMLADLRAHPPDFVALVDRPHGGFGVGPFGADPRNGQRLMEFVRAEYDVVQQVGAVPFRDQGFGVTILRRHAPGSATSPAQTPPPAQISP